MRKLVPHATHCPHSLPKQAYRTNTLYRYFQMAHHRQSHYGSQNDQMEHLLQSKVGSLKDIAIKIGDEAKYQNKLLRDMVRI